MSCKDKHFPINPAPFAPGDCHPVAPCHPPRPPFKPDCPPSQYVGSRYVPVFADPLEWDINRAYESLTIVTHNNESYTSRCNVAPGVDITNARYWAKTGAYNAQLEQYRGEVKDLSSQVTGFASDNAEFREKMTQFEKDNASMKNTVAEDKARVDSLAERVSTAESEIDGLQATTTQHTTAIADLSAADADLQRQITSNDNDIAAIQAKNTEQDGRLDAIDTLNKAQSTGIAQNTADIARNTKNIQDNAANIAVNAHELADHAEQLKDHEARLTSQHKEIADNHAAIERNTSDIASLRADLTQDETAIESNRDAIAHIQEKDVEQDGRLDALEKRTTNAETRLDGLDEKTDATNTALSVESTRAKAAEVANGKLIAANAAELADHAAELTDHEKRITALETDNATNKNDISNIIAKNVAQDTAISAAQDTANHAVETAESAEGKANANAATIGAWDENHPDKTISQAVSDCSAGLDTVKNGLSSTNENVTRLENTKADKSDIPDTSDFATHAEVTAVDTKVGDIADISKTVTDREEYSVKGFASIAAFIGDIVQTIADNRWFLSASQTDTTTYTLAKILDSMETEIYRLEENLRNYVTQSVYKKKMTELDNTNTQQTKDIAANKTAIETKVEIANNANSTVRSAAVGTYVVAGDDSMTLETGRCIRFLIGTSIAGTGTTVFPDNLKVYDNTGAEISQNLGSKRIVRVNGLWYGEIYLGSPIASPAPFYVVVANPATTEST